MQSETERFERLGAVFQVARRLPVSERETYVHAALADDRLLAQQALRLLSRHEETGGVASAAAGRRVVEDAWAAAGGVPHGSPPRVAGLQVLRHLASGATGEVYEAQQEHPSRVVAVKVLREDAMTAEMRRRFRREAQLLATLRHEGIAAVHSVGELDDGRPYLVLDLVDGPPLTHFVREGILSVRERVRLMCDVADAVAHAHRNGVIHRDLKPGNILVAADGRPKVLDFGVARGLDANTVQTSEGRILGTLAYMSPEQAAGESVDTRSDVFALGVLAAESLTGTHPFRRDTAAGTVKAIAESAPNLGGLKGDLALVVRTALDKDPARRYENASAFAEDLRRWMRAEPIHARPPSAAYQLRTFVRRNRALVGLAALALLALIGGLVAALRLAHESEVQRQRAERTAARAETESAGAALARADPRGARTHLERVPEALRGWCWQLTRSLLERHVVARLPLPPAPPGAAPPAAIRCVVRADGSAHEAGRRREPPPIDGLPGTFVASRPLVLVDDQERVLLRTVPGPPLGARRIARFDGHDVLADNATVRLALRDGRERRLPDVPDLVFGVDVDLESNRVAIACRDGNVYLVRWSDGTPLATLRGHGSAVRAAAFDAHGRRLATASTDGTVRIWNVRSRALTMQFEAPDGVEGLAFTLDDAHLCAVAQEEIRTWALATAPLADDVLRLHEGAVEGNAFPYVYSVALTRRGRRLVTCGWDGTVRVASAVDHQVLATLRAAHRAVVDAVVTPDGHSVVVASTPVRFGPEAGSVERFDLRSGRRLVHRTVPGQTVRMTVAPDGASVAALGVQELVLLDAQTLERLDAWNARAVDHQGVAFAANGLVAAHWTEEGQLRVALFRRGRSEPVWKRAFSLSPVAVAAHGDLVAVGDERGSIHLLDAATGDVRGRLDGHVASVYALAFRPGGALLSSGADDNTIRIWDVADRSQALVLRGHTRYVYDLAWSRDGAVLASASGDNTVRIWSARPFQTRLRAAREYAMRRAAAGARVDARLREVADRARAVETWDEEPEVLDEALARLQRR